MTLRVLVIDDTITYRTIVSEALRGIPDVEVIGTANTGSVALTKMERLQPDLVTLDLEMPDMNGLQVLEAMRERKLPCAAVMVSAFTERGGQLTIEALEAGAFDFVTKSAEGDRNQQMERLRSDLTFVLRSFQRRRPPPAPTPAAPPADKPPPKTTTPPQAASAAKPIDPASEVACPVTNPAVLLVGVSTGGPNALTHLIPAFPASLPVPVVIVQHMPPLFTRHLAESLDRLSSLAVHEASHNQAALPGHVYIAPGGHHLKLARSGKGELLLRVSDEPAENHCRPSVDVLFRSAALQMPGRAIAVILTGMGSDGTRGLRLLRRHTAFAIAQDRQSSAVYGMPKEAVDAGLIDLELPLSAIAPAILRCLR